jgi:hypothetical protein
MNRISPRISRREWRKVLLYALVIILLTSVPYVLGYVQQGNNWHFSGFVFGVDDGYSYLAKMRLGARGILDFYLFYTPEPHSSAALIFLPYMLPGWLVGRFISDHDPNLVPALTLVFHLMRVMFDTLLIVVLYHFIAVFLRAPRTRFMALLLATLGGGLGWLLFPLGSEPPEFFIPEGFSWLILLGLPHLALARAALLGGLVLVVKAVVSRQSSVVSPKSENQGPTTHRQPLVTILSALSTRHSVLAALCWLVVGITVPFYLAIVYVIVATWGLMAWVGTRRFPLRLAVNGGLAAALTLPLFLYYSLVFSSNPVFGAWSAQNILTSPPPLHYVLAYGLLAGLALVGWKVVNGYRLSVNSGQSAADSQRLIVDSQQSIVNSQQSTVDSQQANRQSPIANHSALSTQHSALGTQHSALSTRHFLLLWPLVVPLLVYLPMISVQRRLAEAILVPLAIGAAAGLRVLGRSKRWRRLRTLALVLLCSSSIIFLLITVVVTVQPTQPLYRPVDEVRALNWLNDHALADSVVLAAFETGNILPAYANLRPYVGHGPETLRATEKTTTVKRFFANEMTTEERRALYASVNIRYIIYGPLERALAGEVSGEPGWTADGQKVYDEAGYSVYELTPLGSG